MQYCLVTRNPRATLDRTLHTVSCDWHLLRQYKEMNGWPTKFVATVLGDFPHSSSGLPVTVRVRLQSFRAQAD